MDWANELEYVRRAAREVLTAEGVEIWLCAPNPWLNGATPSDLVLRGESTRVLTMIEALASGVYL